MVCKYPVDVFDSIILCTSLTINSAVTQVCSHLTSALSVPPAQSWVSTFLSSQKPTTPLPSLLATAKVRLLNAEITNAFAPSTALPSDIHDATLKERRMQGPIVVQVLDVSDMTRSLWSQVEAIEAAERGEGKKGREVIRVVVSDQSSETLESTAFEGGMHKLLLQDAKGVRVFGLELKKVKGLRLGMNIGTKVRNQHRPPWCHNISPVSDASC